MNRLSPLYRRLPLAALLALLVGCMSAGSAPLGGTPGGTLKAYADDAELTQALDRWRAEAQKRQAERRREALSMQAPGSPPMPMAAPAPAPATAAAPAAKMAESSVGNAAAAPMADGITNVQTAGVDEGGIVKRAGDHLVVLRRGRLFTLRVGGDALEPVAAVDAYAPNADPRGAWYDELLVSGSTVVVVGYSYARGGTEIGLFDLDARGGLRHRSTYHLRSFDYWSARNYASRLIGRQLVFYSPTILSPGGRHPMQMLPGVRRWGDAPLPGDGWNRLLPATRIFRTDDDFDPAMPLALHTITRCDLGDATLRCESSAVLGPPGRVFYVSQGSVYVWTSGRASGSREATSAVFRIPLDGAAPTALKTVGVPIDQLSFLEDASGHLNVLLRAQGAGEGMWGQLRLSGGTAQLRVPLSAFGDGRDAAQANHYRSLPATNPAQNRYVGDWLLLGGGNPYRRDASGSLGSPAAWAVRYADLSSAPVPLDPGHAVERIEAMGRHAVLVGNAGSELTFSAVRLGRGDATLAGRHVQSGARQGETRTHGFYHLPTGPDEGLLGLPILEPSATARSGVYRGGQGAASVLFLRERDLDFHALGALRSEAVSSDDGCKASCVDWYGNARPLFIGSRVFALMGYELVEGRLDGRGRFERIDERRRVHFAPRPGGPGGRASPFSN